MTGTDKAAFANLDTRIERHQVSDLDSQFVCLIGAARMRIKPYFHVVIVALVFTYAGAVDVC